MLPAWHLLGPRSLPLVPCWANSYVMLLHFGQLSEYISAAEKSPNRNFEMVGYRWSCFHLISDLAILSERIPQNHCWSNWSNMLINPPANICLRLVYHICNKSTNLHNILVYCKHTGMWYKYFDIHMTAYINMFAPSNVLMKYASPSGWYYSAAPMLWCQAVIKYVNTSRGPSAFGRSTKLNDKAIIWSKPRLGVDTHQMDTMIGERLQTKPHLLSHTFATASPQNIYAPPIRWRIITITVTLVISPPSLWHW